MNPSQQFLVTQGNKMLHDLGQLAEQVALDIDRIEFDTLFEDNEELAIALLEEFAHIGRNLAAMRLPLVTGVVASGTNPQTGNPLTEEDGYAIQTVISGEMASPAAGDFTDPRGEGDDTLEVPEDL